MVADKLYEVYPHRHLPPDVVEAYWGALEEAGTLALRFCNMDNPTVKDAMAVTARFPQQFYYVHEDDKVVAEFMLENFTGKAAQIHFSMHPNNPLSKSLTLASEVSSAILDVWKNTIGEPYLDTLYGLTPTTNRPACVFVLRTGFKKMGILPSGIIDRGVVTDAMMTIKQRTH